MNSGVVHADRKARFAVELAAEQLFDALEPRSSAPVPRALACSLAEAYPSALGRSAREPVHIALGTHGLGLMGRSRAAESYAGLDRTAL